MPRARLERLGDAMRGAWFAGHNRKMASLSRLEASLTHLDPRKVLARGYSIVRDGQSRIVRDSRSLEPNDEVTVSFHAGRAEARITSVQH
jgi:exodeoxyribonuclease VII large subunit